MCNSDIDSLDLLKQMAKNYIWWKTPDEAIKYPNRIIAQVMDVGDWYDVEKLIAAVGKKTIYGSITNCRSWAILT